MFACLDVLVVVGFGSLLGLWFMWLFVNCDFPVSCEFGIMLGNAVLRCLGGFADCFYLIFAALILNFLVFGCFGHFRLASGVFGDFGLFGLFLCFVDFGCFHPFWVFRFTCAVGGRFGV